MEWEKRKKTVLYQKDRFDAEHHPTLQICHQRQHLHPHPHRLAPFCPGHALCYQCQFSLTPLPPKLLHQTLLLHCIPRIHPGKGVAVEGVCLRFDCLSCSGSQHYWHLRVITLYVQNLLAVQSYFWVTCVFESKSNVKDFSVLPFSPSLACHRKFLCVDIWDGLINTILINIWKQLCCFLLKHWGSKKCLTHLVCHRRRQQVAAATQVGLLSWVPVPYSLPHRLLSVHPSRRLIYLVAVSRIRQ